LERSKRDKKKEREDLRKERKRYNEFKKKKPVLAPTKLPRYAGSRKAWGWRCKIDTGGREGDKRRGTV